MFKRTFAAIMILAAMLCVAVQADARDKDDSWLVYMYISGTNLEEGGHQATNDIANMQHVKLPPNIKVLLYVGGSKEWHHPTIAAGGDGIYLYSSNRLEKLVDMNENMGDPNTLATFLEYGEENFPADHRIIIFQNHGGVNGICYDDKFAQEVKSEDGQTGKKRTNAFSVINLSKMPELREAYEAYFQEAADRSESEIGFSGAFGRAAEARNVDRYSNWYVDLGLLAKNTRSLMPKTSDKLLRAIDKAVVHNRHGAYLQCKGISTYYPYTSLGIGYNGDSVISVTNENGDETDFAKNFLNMNFNYDGQKNFYRKLFGLDFSDFDAVPLRNSNGHFVATLTPEQLKNVSSIQCVMFPLTAGNGDSGFGPINFGGAILTSIDDLKINWKKGTVIENFRGVEPVFDGHKILMNPVSGGRGNTFYEVPIIYNKIFRRNLIVRYDTSTKKYSIVGFGNTVENGMVRTVTGAPAPGSIITPIYYSIVSEDDVKENEAIGVKVDPNTGRPEFDPETGNPKLVMSIIDEYTVNGKTYYFKQTLGNSSVFTQNSAITEKKITNGSYLYGLSFTTPSHTGATSLPGVIVIKNGKIARFTTEDLIEAAKSTDAE